jgi:glycosyltransferase involved in cell wall biosynthesis
MTRPIRVVRIIDRLNIGGPAKHVTWLSAGLNAGEFETTLLTGVVPETEGDMQYFAEAAGVTPIVIPQMSRELGLRDAIVIVKLLRLFFTLKPQIIHTHKAKAGAAGRLAATIYKWLTPSALWLKPRPCRVVHTFHGHIFHSYYGAWKTRIFIVIESLLARFCTDAIITISEQQRQEIAETLRLKNYRKFQVIPLGIDFDEVSAEPCELRHEYGWGDEETLIGIVGRLCEVKNQAMFLQAAAQVLQSLPGSNLRFVVIGDGHLRPALEGLARQLGLAEKVIFTGFRKDAARLYSSLDLVALTSLNEGTPLTLIEAMGCACPVVATEVGGVVDILGTRLSTVDGVSIWQHGATVSSGDDAGFARALEFLLVRKALRAQMGEQGQAFVKARLSKARLLGDIENLYHQLAGVASHDRQEIELKMKVESLQK